MAVKTLRKRSSESETMDLFAGPAESSSGGKRADRSAEKSGPAKKKAAAKRPASRGRRAKGSGSASAETTARKQREISISEFFTKNRHLLGFDNPRKALLTTIKEAVDNSLDACEEAHILPEIHVILKQLDDDRFRITVRDNGPGIVKQQIPNIFGKLLYGSKFHRSRWPAVNRVSASAPQVCTD